MKSLVPLLILASGLALRAEPFKPTDDSIIVEKLPRSLVALQKSSFRAARTVKNLDLAQSLSLTREYLQIAQRTSDPALVRYAEATLAPWPPAKNPDLLFLRAIIRQHKHDFAAALDDLGSVIRLVPTHEEAALLRASILTTQGKYSEVKSIFSGNLRLTSSLRGLTLLLTATSLSGSLTKSEETLERSIPPHGSAPEQAFAWCALAEMAVRRGDPVRAEARFQRSLELEPGDSYTLAAYCDLLLSERRITEAKTRLEPATASEALLTRRFLASQGPLEEVRPFLEQLKVSGHSRELAMLQLNLLVQPALALQNALANWENQKEPIDALLVLRAALASGSPAAADSVTQWIKTTSLEDERLRQLARQRAKLAAQE